MVVVASGLPVRGSRHRGMTCRLLGPVRMAGPRMKSRKLYALATLGLVLNVVGAIVAANLTSSGWRLTPDF